MIDGGEHVDGIHCDDINAVRGVSLSDAPHGPQKKRYSAARLNQLRAIEIIDRTWFHPERIPQGQPPSIPPREGGTFMSCAAPRGQGAETPLSFINPETSENLGANFSVLLHETRYIVGRAHTPGIIFSDVISNSLGSAEPLQFFSLSRTAIIKAGLKLRELGESPLPNRKNYTVLFDGTPMPIYTDITRYETV